MKRLVIGLDIDGVIVDLGSVILPLLSEVCNRKVAYQDLSSWDLGEALNIDESTLVATWERILKSDLLLHAPAISGAIEGLSAIGNHEIWLVTGRPLSTRDLTLSWFRDNKVHYDHIVFSRRGSKLSAGPKFDMFVEDFVDEALAFAGAGIFTILFDQPWNTTSTLPENCQRVYDWNAILMLINDLAES